MSGAAGIAAAKNRRSKPDPNKRPTIDCNSVNGSCPPKSNNQQQNRSIPIHTSTMENVLVDPISMKILGPMPTPQVLKVHEQRLNRIDEQLSQGINSSVPAQQQTINSSSSEEYKRQIEGMEEKIRMLEEVIMNLQLTITNVQGFAMETNLTMMKIKREQEKGATDISVPDVSTEITVPDVVNHDEIVTSNITFTTSEN